MVCCWLPPTSGLDVETMDENVQSISPKRDGIGETAARRKLLEKAMQVRVTNIPQSSQFSEDSSRVQGLDALEWRGR